MRQSQTGESNLDFQELKIYGTILRHDCKDFKFFIPCKLDLFKPLETSADLLYNVFIYLLF